MSKDLRIEDDIHKGKPKIKMNAHKKARIVIQEKTKSGGQTIPRGKFLVKVQGNRENFGKVNKISGKIAICKKFLCTYIAFKVKNNTQIVLTFGVWVSGEM